MILFAEYFARLIKTILISNVMVLFRWVFKDGFVLSVILLSVSELHLHPFELLFPIWQAKVRSSGT